MMRTFPFCLVLYILQKFVVSKYNRLDAISNFVCRYKTGLGTKVGLRGLVTVDEVVRTMTYEGVDTSKMFE